MKTSKPFSTISYNTSEFLQNKLQDLVDRRILSFFAFIKHTKEQDENKDHIHCLMIPNGLYQTDGLFDYLSEPDYNNLSNKPLGIMPCQSSKWCDWYLYCTHDKAYLASKGQSRKYHYLEEDFITSDIDYLHELVRTIDRTKYAKTQDFVDKVINGTSLYDMVVSGQIPVPQFNQWRNMYDYLKYGDTYRNDRRTHSPRDNPEVNQDGEIIKPKLQQCSFLTEEELNKIFDGKDD